MMLSPVQQGSGSKSGMRHTITHVVMRRTRSAFAKVGRFVTPVVGKAKVVPYHWMDGCLAPLQFRGMVRNLRVVQPVFLSNS